jgi:hypothetical protein
LLLGEEEPRHEPELSDLLDDIDNIHFFLELMVSFLVQQIVLVEGILGIPLEAEKPTSDEVMKDLWIAIL